MNVTFSILVPVYNVEQYLTQCVDSILAQTYTNFEVILVDDGSPDRCGEMCDEYAAQDSRVRVIHKPNGGLISARKAGMAVAKGEYICFVDSDDFIANDMLETYHDILKSEKVDMICAGFSMYYAGRTSQIQLNVRPGRYSREQLEKEIYPHMLSLKPLRPSLIAPSVCLKCFRKKIVEDVYKHVPEEIAIGEDVAVTYPALLRADAIYVVGYYGYMYRQNTDSMTHAYNKNLYSNMKILLSYLYNVADAFQWDGKQQICEYAITMLFYSKDNELVYNREDRYAVKKKKLKEYLTDPIFRDAINNVKLESERKGFVLFCLKHHLIFPLFLWNWIRECIAGKK